jgi:glycoside/pentoside/hexuronide:cation symporter, GPH family
MSISSDHLPFRVKLIYGLGDWGNTTTSTIFIFFFSFFLNDVARLQPLYALPVLLIGGIWDAINDPIIGVLADRVRSRWGRRRPLFLLGALPLSISFIMMWWVPNWDSQILKACYYTFVYVVFDTAFTMLTIPYSALTAELTEDYDERTHLTGYRMAVSMAGGMIAAVVVPMLRDAFADVRTGYMVAGIIFGSLASVPYFLLFFNIRERPLPVDPHPLSVIKGFVYTFRNKAFRYAAMIYMTAWITVNLVAALMQYYVTHWMNMADKLDIILGLVQASALVCIPVIVWLSGKFGKQRAYAVGLVWWAAVMLALAFLPPQARTLAYILAGLAGLGIAAAHVIPWSMVPDVIEADEMETGQRREGAYYGFLVFIMKTGSAFTLALMQWIFHLTGYQPGVVQQNHQTLLAIRMLIGPVPAVLLFTSILLAWRFPITRKKHAALRVELAERRQAAENPAD